MDSAEAELKRYVILDGRSKAHYELSEFYAKRSMFEQALLAGRKACFLDTNNSKAYNYVGVTLYFLKDFNNAKLNLDKAIFLDKANKLFYFNRGQTNFELNNI